MPHNAWKSAQSFKTNFRQATLIWLLLMLVAAILGGDYYIITKSGMQFSQVLVVLIMAAGYNSPRYARSSMPHNAWKSAQLQR